MFNQTKLLEGPIREQLNVSFSILGEGQTSFSHFRNGKGLVGKRRASHTKRLFAAKSSLFGAPAGPEQ